MNSQITFIVLNCDFIGDMNVYINVCRLRVGYLA